MWKPGDMAVTVNCSNERHNGVILHVTSTEYAAPDGDLHVDIEPFEYDGSIYVSAITKYLKKIPGEYDGNETTTWDECPWQPAKEEITI